MPARKATYHRLRGLDDSQKALMLLDLLLKEPEIYLENNAETAPVVLALERSRVVFVNLHHNLVFVIFRCKVGAVVDMAPLLQLDGWA